MNDDPFKFTPEPSGKDAASPGAEGEGPSAGSSGSGRGLGSLKNLLSGNWLLVGLFVAGLASLYAMSLMKGPAPASAQQMQVQSSVDDALAKLGTPGAAPAAGKATEAIVDNFTSEAKQRQIPTSMLKTNPFVFKAATRPASPTPPTVEPTAVVKPAESTATANALAAAKTLSLQSVLLGSKQPAAIISDNLLTEGQTIRGWTVTKVLAREVHLTWQDQSYVLRMAE